MEMNIRVGVIYMITSPSGRRYIGQTQDLTQRLYHYERLDCKSQKLLYRSLLKYGYIQHNIEVLEECEYHLLDEREVELIALHQCNVYRFPLAKGMNLCDGGGTVRGHKKSPEALEKMSNANLGKKHSEESKLRISAALKGRIKSPAECLAISNSLKGRGLSEEVKLKMRGRKPNKEWSLSQRLERTLLILDTDTGVYYYGIKDAGNAINKNMSSLYKELKGVYRSTTNLMLV